MTEKEKAKELIEYFMPMMYCFVGSEMLTNTFNLQECLNNAKMCAIKVVDEIDQIAIYANKKDKYANLTSLEYWQEIKKEIKLYIHE